MMWKLITNTLCDVFGLERVCRTSFSLSLSLPLKEELAEGRGEAPLSDLKDQLLW